MLTDHFKERILKAFKYDPNEEQMQLINMLLMFYLSDNENSAFLLKGYAGTGKTTLVSAFIRALSDTDQKFLLLAPTGRAAKVLSQISGFPAYTIHKQIYRQKQVALEPDALRSGAFSLGFNKMQDTLFIIDEASMISNQTDELNMFGSGNLLDELMRYIQEGNRCKVLLVGDLAQLPPVGTVLSPALNPDALTRYGLDVYEYTLREVVRQTFDSGILQTATQIRQQLAAKNYSHIPVFNVNNTDVLAVNGADLSEHIGSSFSAVGEDQVMVVTRSNKRANQFNQGIRNTVLYRDEELSVGDHLMVVKNNYFWTEKVKELDFIANGDLIKVERVRAKYELYGKRFADITVSFPDYGYFELDVKIILDSILHDGPSLPLEEMQKLYEEILLDSPEIKNVGDQRKKITGDEFYNALQVKYGYAVTCHKAQGGQWKHVYLDLGYVSDEMVDLEFLRWLYTAVTRASEKLFLVNFPQDILEYT